MRLIGELIASLAMFPVALVVYLLLVVASALIRLLLATVGDDFYLLMFGVEIRRVKP